MQINKIDSSRDASIYENDNSVIIPRNNKAKTGVLHSNKSPKRAHSRHRGIHRYYLLCKKAGIPGLKYTLHSARDCTWVRTKRSIKYGLVEPMGSRTDDVKQYRKSE